MENTRNMIFINFWEVRSLILAEHKHKFPEAAEGRYKIYESQELADKDALLYKGNSTVGIKRSYCIGISTDIISFTK